MRFNSYVGNVSGFFAGAQPNTQYEMYWDDAAGTMKVTGRFECSPGNPCQTVKLQSEQAVSLSFWGNQQGINGYSQSLGGEIFVGLAGVTLPADSASVEVAYRVQDLVYPNDVPATLYCVRDCPTRASLDTFFAQGSQSQSPFTVSSANNFAPTTAQNVVVYHGDSTELLTGRPGPRHCLHRWRGAAVAPAVHARAAQRPPLHRLARMPSATRAPARTATGK